MIRALVLIDRTVPGRTSQFVAHVVAIVFAVASLPTRYTVAVGAAKLRHRTLSHHTLLMLVTVVTAVRNVVTFPYAWDAFAVRASEMQRLAGVVTGRSTRILSQRTKKQKNLKQLDGKLSLSLSGCLLPLHPPYSDSHLHRHTPKSAECIGPICIGTPCSYSSSARNYVRHFRPRNHCLGHCNRPEKKHFINDPTRRRHQAINETLTTPTLWVCTGHYRNGISVEDTCSDGN